MKLDLGKILQSINKGSKPSSDTLFVSNKNNPRLRDYKDSLALYNSIKKYSIDKKKPITAYSKEDLNYLKKLYPNNPINLIDSHKLDSYTKSTFEESGRKSNFKVGNVYSQKDLELEGNKAEQYNNKKAIFKFTKNKGNLITDKKGVAIRSTTIAPIATAYGDMNDKDNWNAGLISLYKKPVQPVAYREEVKKKEEPKMASIKREVEQAIQNKYEGNPVYYPTVGSGGPSALVGFSNNADTTFIKPEDFDRMAVPKYAREFIKSKSRKK